MTPKDQAADPTPKCANCRHMAPIVTRAKDRATGFFGCGQKTVDGPPVRAKGACMEPSLTTAYPQLFYVTDLTLCSLWEPKP